MRSHSYTCEDVKRGGVQLAQERGDVEAVDEEACSTRPIGMGEEVEDLQTAWVCLIFSERFEETIEQM